MATTLNPISIVYTVDGATVTIGGKDYLFNTISDHSAFILSYINQWAVANFLTPAQLLSNLPAAGSPVNISVVPDGFVVSVGGYQVVFVTMADLQNFLNAYAALTVTETAGQLITTPPTG